jgi:hypothetical protein
MREGGIVSQPDRRSGDVFGPLLRSWRTNRRVTQLQLALDAGVSQAMARFASSPR